MKANELMIGDWVTMFPENYRIEGIVCLREKHSGEEKWQVAVTDKDGKCMKTNVEIPSPIPITPEILEKNGFFKHSHFSTDRYELIVEESRVNYWVSKKILDVRGSNHHGDFFDEKIYVHELQHALRLCGIEKEIVL